MNRKEAVVIDKQKTPASLADGVYTFDTKCMCGHRLTVYLRIENYKIVEWDQDDYGAHN